MSAEALLDTPFRHAAFWTSSAVVGHIFQLCAFALFPQCLNNAADSTMIYGNDDCEEKEWHLRRWVTAATHHSPCQDDWFYWHKSVQVTFMKTMTVLLLNLCSYLNLLPVLNGPFPNWLRRAHNVTLTLFSVLYLISNSEYSLFLPNPNKLEISAHSDLLSNREWIRSFWQMNTLHLHIPKCCHPWTFTQKFCTSLSLRLLLSVSSPALSPHTKAPCLHHFPGHRFVRVSAHSCPSQMHSSQKPNSKQWDGSEKFSCCTG